MLASDHQSLNSILKLNYYLLVCYIFNIIYHGSTSPMSFWEKKSDWQQMLHKAAEANRALVDFLLGFIIAWS